MKLFYSPQFLYALLCVKNFFAKLCKTMFFAHMGCAVALTANINKIVFRLLKSSNKIKVKMSNCI